MSKNTHLEHLEDSILLDGEQGAKAQGKWRSEGSDYEVEDGDIILFRFNFINDIHKYC